MKLTLQSAVATFGATAKRKLASLTATGQPEDQLRAPFELLLADMAELASIPRLKVAAVGESSLSDLKTRPDYAVTVHGALVGFVEVKAPGKGANPLKFKDKHDKAQWEKLRSLPNVMYTDGNEFSVWRDGVLVDKVVILKGDIESAGDSLEATPALLKLFSAFLAWEPIPPRSAKELAQVSARLCRFLRDEVTEQMAIGSAALTALATDWRKLLFPDATDERFADGYAQAVTFGLLMARAKEIHLGKGLNQVAASLSRTHSLIGSALRLLTDNAENQATLKTSLGTLIRVLDVVDWQYISKGDPEAWLYFYEDFLEIYDNELRKQTGSYYTPPEVVSAMVRLVDDVLRTDRFGQFSGLASPAVTLADPATGTGTFLLGTLRRIAETIRTDEGQGAVPAAIDSAVRRLIAFEIQLGPFAVAQLRVLAEIAELTGAPPTQPLRMFVTNTLSNPEDDEDWIPGMLAAIANSRKEANKIKRDESITVVLGNPPYKEKAKGRGGWVEGDTKTAEKTAPLSAWMPPASWGVSAHAKHLRNLYVYFWRWATWKVFDAHPAHNTGVVCYITVAGFLNGPGFQRMREYLRSRCDDIWVIDCSPERHQPEVNTRLFQGVQQPICIVLASRSASSDEAIPAVVRFLSLPTGHRKAKFDALARIRLDEAVWTECPKEWRAAFLPSSTGDWSTYPTLDELFVYEGSGTMPGRTWIIAPDPASLEQRWTRLTSASKEEMETLFHPHLSGGQLGDRHTGKVDHMGLPGHEHRIQPVARDTNSCVPPIRYAFRSFDRQWIIPDNRLINRPNPELWGMHSDRQIYLTALSRTAPSTGPAATLTCLIPDLDHYNGRGGRVFPLWRDSSASKVNHPPGLLEFLSKRLQLQVAPEDLFSYIAALVASPAFTRRFQDDLSTPGLRVPITADGALFSKAVQVGRDVIWLHTFGERMVDSAHGRPAKPPRLAKALMPTITAAGSIAPDEMPDSLEYDATSRRLRIGSGFIENVDPAVWAFEVSGKQVLSQWFSYRRLNRDRPVIGDRRPISPLSKIQPERWLAEYTTELLNVLNVLARLVDLEPAQDALLQSICVAPTITATEMRACDALARAPQVRGVRRERIPDMFDDMDS